MDTFPFVLALDLGVPLSTIEAMPYPEYLSWQAYYTYRTAMAEVERGRPGGAG